MTEEAGKPQSVIVDNPEPLPVAVASVAPVVLPSATAQNPPARATTTSEQDKHSYGQRRINMIWETTQALIAIIVTGSTLFVAGRLALRSDGQTAAFLLLSNAFFLVIGFYFSRSNHNRINDLASGSNDRIDTR